MKDVIAAALSKEPLFEPGTVAISLGVIQAVGHDDIATTIMVNCLQRHVAGDFGDANEVDTQGNLESIKNKSGVIVSVYQINTAKGPVKTYMITNADQVITALMLPSERE